MIIIEQYHEIDTWHPEDDFDRIVRAARICYQSEPLSTQEEKERFLKNLIKRGHLSPFEHSSLSVNFITNRGVTHEFVRHRIASYSQESTRYCNYSKIKFDVDTSESNLEREHIKYNKGTGRVRFIWDPLIEDFDREEWLEDTAHVEKTYLKWLNKGYPPEIARDFLSIDTKTQIEVTANLREWRHIFSLRSDKTAHPHFRMLLTPLLIEVQSKIPVVFDDILENAKCQ